MKHYVYMYSDPVRKEPIYVGMGKGGRYKRHLLRTDHHPMTHRVQAMKRAGVEPIITFLCSDIDQEFAALVEQEAISKYGRKDLGKGPLLNLTDGGDGCYNPSPETRRRMSEAATGQKQSPEAIERRAAKVRGIARPPHVIEAMVKANTGAKRSPEARARMRAAQLGKKQTPEQRAKISAGLKAAYAEGKR